MCLMVKDSLSEPNSFGALPDLSLSTVDINQHFVCNFTYFEVYMPTVSKNIKDYLVSTYEICEDG